MVIFWSKLIPSFPNAFDFFYKNEYNMFHNFQKENYHSNVKIPTICPFNTDNHDLRGIFWDECVSFLQYSEGLNLNYSTSWKEKKNQE